MTLDDNGEAFFQAVMLRQTYFRDNLIKVRSCPEREATHSLSTSLKRLLVLDDFFRKCFRTHLVDDKAVPPLKKFRKTLSYLRDSQELSSKLRNLETQNDFCRALLKSISKESRRQQKKLRREIKQLKKYKPGKLVCEKKMRALYSEVNISDLNRLPLLLFNHANEIYQEAITDKDDKALHKLRVRYKGLRYCCEFISDFSKTYPQETLKKLKLIQTELGQAHDWLVMLDKARDLKPAKMAEARKEFIKNIKTKLSINNKKARALVQAKWAELEKIARASTADRYESLK